MKTRHRTFRCLLALSSLAVLSGCTYLHSTTVKETDPKTGLVRETTKMRAGAFLDSRGALAKFRNTTGGYGGSNNWVSGTSIGTLDQSASSSNLVTITGNAAAIAGMLAPVPK